MVRITLYTDETQLLIEACEIAAEAWTRDAQQSPLPHETHDYLTARAKQALQIKRDLLRARGY